MICSNDYLRDFAIKEMVKCFLECGYDQESLSKAVNRVQQLKRGDLLQVGNKVSDESPLVFTLPFSVQKLEKDSLLFPLF